MSDKKRRPNMKIGRTVSLFRGACLLLCSVAVLSMPQKALAAKFIVNSTDDIVDAVPGNGICETAPGNHICTLRAAIQEANAFSGPDKIVLKAMKYVLIAGNEGEGGGTGEDAAATGDLDITESVTIAGRGSAYSFVDGGHLDRVFHVLGSPSDLVKFVGITIQNGGVLGSGGGIFNDSDATVIVKQCRVKNNLAFAACGGGICSSGPLKVISSIITQNTLYYGMAMSHALGGGIALEGPNAALTVTESKISGNSVSAVVEPAFGESGSAWGGGIGAYGAKAMVISNTKIINNVTDSWSPTPLASSGGGLFISDNTDTAVITASKVSNNVARGAASNGAGIALINTSTQIDGCTVTENSTNGFSVAEGGGLYLQSDFTMTVALTGQSRIKNNYAASGGGGIFTSGAVVLSISADVTVAKNTPNDIIP